MATSSKQKEQTHWLDRYAAGFHTWMTCVGRDGQTAFQRPLGLVETSFDSDGAYYGGRADMTGTLSCEVRHVLSAHDFRRRVAAAWACLRLRHVLLLSRRCEDGGLRCFRVDVPRSVEEAVRDVEESTTWVGEWYGEVDECELHEHALNVARVVEPEECLSKLLVLPLQRLPGGKTYQLRFLIVMAHQISDGLSAYGWFKDFIRILNLPAVAMEEEIKACLHPDAVRARLPPAQEDLYPRILGNKARQRWIWAIIRVLRHVKKTPPPTFPNPLYRAHRLSEPVALEPIYSKLFSYRGDNMPPLSTGHLTATLSPAASARLITLCRAAKLSIGAGCFALAGLAMMDTHAAQHLDPSTPPTQIPAMTASFPLNPRAFFADPPPAESCMLAFSDGIVLPFLPATLPIEPRFRLAARTANRELRAYQKRLRTTGGGRVSAGLDRHSPARLLAAGYVSQIERGGSKLPADRRRGFASPQGQLQASGGFAATCGVSSVGSLKGYFRPGEYDLADETKDFVVDYRGLRMGVRARDGEFLVGSSTDAEGRVGFGVSYDMNAIDRKTAERWAETITGLLEKRGGSRL
ncbi:uncharacterized protein EKO05_0002047 [Ascochyta rabiei]|uniref:Uncharacterized protein n=1 Tax=Didymella rabiei TaxID=5454 RepID=A0A163LQH8_DIDRA|nr:uncharacterized protein EKO05_0002047 [Ascochyta rabiei]KZM28012.1 hypothetical protein ST47_g841 [Ascochyta rabiei]UPX11441.1 hypothetical protein EKO05_0002047 [Ascochyta rabiei]